MKSESASVFTIALLFVLHGICQSQPLKDSTPTKETVVKQATAMANAFIQKDYETFAKFNHPRLLSLFGGKQKMIAQMTKEVKEMESQGTGFLSVEIGTPAEIIHTKMELQCVLSQLLTMKVTRGKLITKSSLVGVSSDKGSNWVFIDSGENDLKKLQTVVPSLSNRLQIPVKDKPTFYPD